MERDQEFVEYIIKGIVNNPDDVEVTRKVDEMGVLIEVKVNPSDMGLLIGRSGATAKAIRVLARIMGMRNNARVNLRIIEPEGGLRSQNPRDTSGAVPQTEGSVVAGVQMKEKAKDIEDVVNDLGM